MVTWLVMTGLLEQHLKPWLYSGPCPTPRFGLSSIPMLRLRVLPLRVLFTLLVSVELYEPVMALVAGK